MDELDGSYCLLTSHETEQAAAFRVRWGARWGGIDPSKFPAVDGMSHGHAHAWPEFRSPLPRSSRSPVEREFVRAALARLAPAQSIDVVVAAWSVGDEPVPVVPADLGPLDHWLTILAAGPSDDPELRATFFVASARSDDDALLDALSSDASWLADYSIEAVVDAADRWLARPRDDCFHLVTDDPHLLDALSAVEAETWARYRVPDPRPVLLDLAAVTRLVEQRLPGWAEQGVVLDAAQYRMWADGAQYDSLADEDEVISIVHDLPASLDRTDWYRFELARGDERATVDVHDGGALRIDLELDDCSCDPSCAACFGDDDVEAGPDIVCSCLDDDAPYVDLDPGAVTDVETVRAHLDRAVRALVAGPLRRRDG
ncbi:hypothetical protein [Nocardioides zeae]|uniref:Uncharacterized protein n=1 Tax=Nocardioides zeae TaxID=1457234 RepID=A0AAJ1TXE1_9ACTN|nr:hypothetical protein [Nocardioides zeae]MDQ1103529.1 hypothetical protein [Nocardioides zeae]